MSKFLLISLFLPHFCPISHAVYKKCGKIFGFAVGLGSINFPGYTAFLLF